MINLERQQSMKNLENSIGHSQAAAPEPAQPRPLIPSAPAPALSKLYALRRLAGKLSRRCKKLAGKPDNSPWVLRPRTRGRETTFVDFLFGLDYLSPNSRLVEMFHEAMSPYGVSVLLVNQSNVDRVIAEIDRGWLQPHVLLDLASCINPRFNDLANAASKQGIYVIDDPRDINTWTLKSSSHPRLERAGLPLPPTVIFAKGSPDRELTPSEQERIGPRAVIKPSFEYANRGVVVGAEPTAPNISKARDFNRDDDWLVQKMISGTSFGIRPAYLRAYQVLGHRSLMWWSKQDDLDRYELCTWEDLRKYDLLPAIEIIDRIAAVSGVDFFSSEIAITSETGPGRFVLIDQINDQCDMDPEDRPGTTAVPEPWVKWVCGRMADFVWRKKNGIASDSTKTLTLF